MCCALFVFLSKGWELWVRQKSCVCLQWVLRPRDTNKSSCVACSEIDAPSLLSLAWLPRETCLQPAAKQLHWRIRPNADLHLNKCNWVLVPSHCARSGSPRGILGPLQRGAGKCCLPAEAPGASQRQSGAANPFLQTKKSKENPRASNPKLSNETAAIATPALHAQLLAMTCPSILGCKIIALASVPSKPCMQKKPSHTALLPMQHKSPHSLSVAPCTHAARQGTSQTTHRANTTSAG